MDAFLSKARRESEVPHPLKWPESRLKKDIQAFFFFLIFYKVTGNSLFIQKKNIFYLIKNAKLPLHLTKMTSISHVSCSGVLEYLWLVTMALLQSVHSQLSKHGPTVSTLCTSVSFL